MPSRKSPSSSAAKPALAVERRILSDVLKAIGRPALPQDLSNVLLLLGHGEFEGVRRLREEELRGHLEALVSSGEAVCHPEGRYVAADLSSQALREIYSRPEYGGLPAAVAHALPMVGVHGETNEENLRRDLRNAFFAADVALLNHVLNTMRDVFPGEYKGERFLDFLFDEPEEWLLSLPDPFLQVCAWCLLPSASSALRPVRRLAERCLPLADITKPKVVCSLLDYTILCGDWKCLQSLMQKLKPGQAARELRLGWIRFLTGRDEEAVGHFREALDQVRGESHSHDGYFRTVGGVFAILGFLREGSAVSLNQAGSYAKAGSANDTPYTVVYQLLQQVVQAKAHPDLPPVQPVWHSDSRLNNIFACVAHYWLTGSLDGGQRLLLESSAQSARAGGYLWLAEECEELLQRLRNPEVPFRRFHDLQNGKMPFFLDCVITRNSWVERFERLKQALDGLPQPTATRLVWNVNAEQAERGIITVKPIEQHSSRNGKWTKGRRFTAYRECRFGTIQPPAEPPMGEMLFQGLTPQDKFACDLLYETEEELKKDPEKAAHAWGKVIQALQGHPRLFLEGGDGQPLHCVPGEPVVEVTPLEDALQYSLLPQAPQEEECVVRLERGNQLTVYTFPTPIRRLRRALSGDFRIPLSDPQENGRVLEHLLRRFRVISQGPLPGISLPPVAADPLPCLQLTNWERGLRVAMMVQPFGSSMPYYLPGEGPMEMICQEVRMVRDFERERERAEAVVQSCPRLRETVQEEPWRWSLEGQACYELTLQLQGMSNCRVQVPNDRKFVCRRTLTMSNISLHTQSYLSWFSVEGDVVLEGSEATASLADLIQAVAERKHFVTLSDGDVVALSEDVRLKLEALNRLGDIVRGRGAGEGGGALRICQFLMPFLQEQLAFYPGLELPPESDQWIEKYNKAMKEEPPVPKELQVTLRPYQEEGFLWLSRLDSAGAGACLADDMGLGKTVQAIALILSKASEGPSLVVAPTSVCANWQAEFGKFAPSLVCEVFGPGDRSQSFQKLGPGHVLIASYGLLQSEQASFRKVQWRVAVLDEAQAIKNSHAKRSQAALEIHADFRVVTTGTPVENNLNELWSIFNFIIPGLLGTREGFQKRFATTIENERKPEVMKELMENLRGIVSPFLLRRRKDQVLNDLPPKEEIDYPVELSPQERAFYDDLRKKIVQELNAVEKQKKSLSKLDVLSGITRLRLAVDHPRLVAGGEGLAGSKLEAFMELLQRILENGHKVLVFSQFVKFLEIVRETLEAQRIPYEYLDGARNAKERAASVENFQNGEVPVFLISLRAGGVGLNLTQADYVIHLDSWWNPAVENQASDRAYRLGQSKKVTIYHLHTVNTIEDEIKRLHEKKTELADNLLANADTIETVPMEALLQYLRKP